MIRITVELVSARTGNTTHLGTAHIYNDNTGTLTKGNYEAVFSKRSDPDSVWKTSRIKDFPRKRLLMWDLLFQALKPICQERT